MPKHGSIKATYVRCMRVLAVTCHLHFWQNDRDFLRATVVTRGWNGYRNKSQHRSRPWRRKFSRRFNHESGALTTELSPPLKLFMLQIYIYSSVFGMLCVRACVFVCVCGGGGGQDFAL